MKKRIFFLKIVIFLSLLTVLQAVAAVGANPIPPSWAKMTITIITPANETQTSLPVYIKFTADTSYQSTHIFGNGTTTDWIGNFYYVIDGQSLRYAGTKIENVNMSKVNGVFYFNGQTYIPYLPEGRHNLTIYCGILTGSLNGSVIGYNPAWLETTQFYVDSKLTPMPRNPNATATPTQTHYPTPPETSPVSIPITICGLQLDSMALTEIFIAIIILVSTALLSFYFKWKNSKTAWLKLISQYFYNRNNRATVHQ
jgi:hypothetical protein